MSTAAGSPNTCGNPRDICTPAQDVSANFPPGMPQQFPGSANLGLQAGDDINSFSWGLDALVGPNVIRFSVSSFSGGWGGGVMAEFSGGNRADIFSGGTFGTTGMNTLVVDGDGLPAGAPPALGLVEESGGAAPYDELNALSTCNPACMADQPAYFTLAPGSPTLVALGAGPEDVLKQPSFGTPKPIQVEVQGKQIGLVPGDIIDALAYDTSKGMDFSLAPGSPSLSTYSAWPGDILDVTVVPGAPFVLITGDSMGLSPGPDNLDALDIAPDKNGDLVNDNCAGAFCPLAPRAGCRAPGKAVLILKNKGGIGNKLVWKWLRGAATNLTDFGDPVASNDYALCLYDNAGSDATSTLKMAVGLSSGNAWKTIGTRGFKYQDKTAGAYGITKVILKSGTAGKAKVLIRGKGAGLPLPALPLTQSTKVTVQLVTDQVPPDCWTSEFSAPPRTNSATIFKDRE